MREVSIRRCKMSIECWAFIEMHITYVHATSDKSINQSIYWANCATTT